MHYYSHNIADYRKDTGHLSLLEHGLYRQLLDTYYLDEKPIETQPVIRRLSIRTEDEKQALENVLADFFQVSECGKFYTHKRCDDEIEAYKAKADTARVNGSKGGRPKKPKKTQRVNSRNPEKTGSKANHKPLTINQEPLTNIYTFEDFWAGYPRKEGKSVAEKSWGKIKQVNHQLIFENLEARAKAGQWQDVKFIPHASTYLNQERWKDVVIHEVKSTRDRSLGEDLNDRSWAQ